MSQRATILAGTLGVAAVLRLWAPSLASFREDPAYWSLEAWRLLATGNLPLQGQQVGSVTVDFHNGPLMTYLTAAVFGLFGYRPVAMCVFVALCSVLGLWVMYVLGSRLQPGRLLPEDGPR